MNDEDESDTEGDDDTDDEDVSECSAELEDKSVRERKLVSDFVGKFESTAVIENIDDSVGILVVEEVVKRAK